MSGRTLELNGYTDVPNGKIAVVVTYLQMLSAPSGVSSRQLSDITLDRWMLPKAEEYKALFRRVGEDWIWFGRLAMEDAALEDMLGEPARENFVPMRNGKPMGMLELDYSSPQEPEIAYFGLVPEAIGGGLGRWLMAKAVDMAWARPETERLWLHTCTADSPQALRFYMSCGFKPYKRSIEIADDPRLTGLHGKDMAPHIPVID